MDDQLFSTEPDFDELCPPPAPSRAVVCPTCGAQIGKPCKSPSGHVVWNEHGRGIHHGRVAS